MQNLIKKYTNECVKREIENFTRHGSYEFLTGCQDSMAEDLSGRIFMASKDALEKLFMSELAENKLLLAYVKENPEKACEIEAIKEQFICKLQDDKSTYLSQKAPRLLSNINMVKEQYFNSIQEVCERFERDKEQIETKLLQGKRIGHITKIDAGLGDKHNHGRSTTLIETDAGNIIYKPRSMEIDAWVEAFCRRFFGDFIYLPETLIFNNYGYSEYIVNSPSATRGDAAEYYYNFGVLSSVALLLRSNDLHMENVLSHKNHPVLIDLETILSPMEQEPLKVGFDYYDSIFSSGLLSYHIEGKEFGTLFSYEDENNGAPVINGIKKNVIDYKNDYLKGFEWGYRNILNKEKEIREFVENMPPLKVRYLLRGSNAYAKTIKKTDLLFNASRKEVEEGVAKALVSAFEKTGEKAPKEIIESEKKAILERNIPIFYTISTKRDLLGANGVVARDYFSLSCQEHILHAINKASAGEMEMALSILRKSMTRVFKENKKLVFKEPDEHTNPIDIAIELADRIIGDVVKSDTGEYLWFSVGKRYANSMAYAGILLGKGTSGIALFLFALAFILKEGETKERYICFAETVYQNIYKASGEIMNDNNITIPPGMVDGLAGLIRANELISHYHPMEACDKCRDIYMDILSKMNDDFRKQVQVALQTPDEKQRQMSLKTAEGNCADTDILYLDSLWEGNCGVIESLLNAGKPDEAKRRLTCMCRRAKARGDFCYIKEEYDNFFEPGFAYGAAGVGYTLLRCEYPDQIKSIFL